LIRNRFATHRILTIVVMRNIIRQTVVLPALLEALFELYSDPRAHEKFTGTLVVIGDEKGAKSQAFTGKLTALLFSM
ncbi:hypothetical protein MYX76_19090, partial [Desulfobacterota bacterium AH_259_B03_O07]|nr:hypothetical protein [Desulfobacterota bacterium AH_259_B03_O07]